MFAKGWPKNFSLAELTRSETAKRFAFDNTPTDRQAEVLRATAWELQAARDVLGPLWITSGFRCSALNRKLGGAKRSDHMVLEDVAAFDVVPVAVPLFSFFNFASRNLRYTKLIWEFGDWVHISVPVRAAVQSVLYLAETIMDDDDKPKVAYRLIGSPGDVLERKVENEDV